MPTQEDVNSNIRQGVLIDLRQFPATKQIEALAKMGGKGYVDGTWYDFTGLGDAEYQLGYNDKMLSTLLEIQREYGPQYVEQRLKELAVADPEGQQVRQALWDKIQGEMERGSDTTDAQTLQDQIYADLGMSGRLTDREARDVNQATLGQQYARGNVYGGAPTLQRATSLVDASAIKKASAQNRATQFLVSGVSPDDVAYRNKQQGMANIGAFLSGQTPTAQFGQLSGAQNQSAPFQPGNVGVGLNRNAGTQAAQFNRSINNSYNAWQNNQVNPYLAGLGMGVQAAGTAYQFQNSPASNPWYTFDYSNVNPADYE
jgi:hypothetical protein